MIPPLRVSRTPKIQCILVEFKLAAAKTNEQAAFNSCIESFSNESPENALAELRVSEKGNLETLLEQVEQENKFTIPTPKERVMRDTKKLQDNLSKLECELVLSDAEKRFMPPHQRKAFERAEQERLAPNPRTAIPNCFLSQATYQKKSVPMTLEIVER